jgi:hypothetical protein
VARGRQGGAPRAMMFHFAEECQVWATRDERDARLLHVHSVGGSYLNRCNSLSVVDVGLKTKHVHFSLYF